MSVPGSWKFFFFNDTATTEIYTLSLHDALPISRAEAQQATRARIAAAAAELHEEVGIARTTVADIARRAGVQRSEEHTSELQSRQYLVCRLLLEKKTKTRRNTRPESTI